MARLLTPEEAAIAEALTNALRGCAHEQAWQRPALALQGGQSATPVSLDAEIPSIATEIAASGEKALH